MCLFQLPTQSLSANVPQLAMFLSSVDRYYYFYIFESQELKNSVDIYYYFDIFESQELKHITDYIITLLIYCELNINII